MHRSLSRMLGDQVLVILGVLITAVALAALVIGLTSAVAPGTITVRELACASSFPQRSP